ncbi:HU family DNA-binding protein [Solidesulfovibrio sp.]|uniref:HU family DNA-binding protein n=1 Tax=Solidesulfovibrio sp. TaxID=2910990 RepID=UPI002611A99F|nr:HU family DNA-binding protein [Solidesulfovibrio sp.]
MTKSELIEKIKGQLAAGTNTKHIHEKTVIAAVLDALGTVAAESLASGGEVPLPGLGKLKAKQRKARMGRNPRTGAPVEISARMAVSFDPGKALTDVLK